MDSLMLQIYNNLGRLPNKKQKTCKMTDILQAQAGCKAKNRRDPLCFLAQNPAVFVKTD